MNRQLSSHRPTLLVQWLTIWCQTNSLYDNSAYMFNFRTEKCWQETGCIYGGRQSIDTVSDLLTVSMDDSSHQPMQWCELTIKCRQNHSKQIQRHNVSHTLTLHVFYGQSSCTWWQVFPGISTTLSICSREIKYYMWWWHLVHCQLQSTSLEKPNIIVI